MKHVQILFLIPVIYLLYSCSPKIATNLSKKYPALDYKQDVLVIGLQQPKPKEAEVLGEIKIGDSGFTTDCDYETVIESAKMEARKVGGNAIKITKHKQPSTFGSTCHRITAEILRLPDVEDYAAKNEDEIIPDADYAVLNVYRFGGMGSAISYDLMLGDSVICRVRNNFKTTLYIKKDGRNTLSVKTESKNRVPINIQFGRTYYIRCGISVGAFVGRPTIDVIDNKTGKAEFESFKAKHQ